MRGSLRLKLALGVFLVLLFGAVSFSHAQQNPSLSRFFQSSDSANVFSNTEELNKFLTTHYAELTPDERNFLQKALLAKQMNEGNGSFFFLPPTRQAEIVGKVATGFFSALWPTISEKGQISSPGVLGYLAQWVDAVLASPRPVTGQQMLASLNPTRQIYAGKDTGLSEMAIGHQTLSGFSGALSNYAITRYWGFARNFAFASLTIVLIVFGFLIMLRQNIEPRVVMTISNALPRVATALVLITFSFAISGLIVDVGRVADGILKTFGTEQATDHSIYTLFASLAKAGLTNIGASLESPEYVWKFDEADLDKNHPDWRCDYDPSCFSAVNFGCTQADGKSCEQFYCSLLPFGLGMKNYDCKIWIITTAIDPPGALGPWCPCGIPLMTPGNNRQAIGQCLDPILAQGRPPGNTYPVPNDFPDGPDWHNTVPCCNRASDKCHGNDVAWAAPFPRSGINILEMWINRLILILVSAILNILFFFTLLQTIISLLFKMISCFAMWFVYTIFSPLVFMWAAVPGQEDTAMSWGKNFLANVLAFPVVNFVINFALILAAGYNSPGTGPANYPSILFIGPNSAVGLLVAYGIILMTPSIPDVLKDLIGAKGGGKGPGLPDMSKQVKRLPIVGGLTG